MDKDIQVLVDGDLTCEHMWVEGITFDTFPSIHTRECDKCGRVEAYSDEALDERSN